MKHWRRPKTTGPDNEAPPSGPIVLDLDGTPIPHAYQHYTVTFVATSSTSFISFAFRDDPAWLGLDDVSVTLLGGGPNLIVNGGFESGPLGASAPSGWAYLNEFEATFFGVVGDASSDISAINLDPRSGVYFYYDGAVQAYDAITQSIPTTIGHTYTISFWLGENSPESTFRRVSNNGLTDTTGNGINLIVYAGDRQPTWISGLDACIASVFEPGNPGSATDSGTISRPRYPISAAVVEAAAAADSPSAADRAPVILSALVDDPASVRDTLDAYLGEIMVEVPPPMGGARDTVNAGLVYAVAVAEAALAADALTASVPVPLSAAVIEAASATSSQDAVAIAPIVHLARTISASRPGVGSAVISDDGTGKTQIIPGIGAVT